MLIPTNQAVESDEQARALIARLEARAQRHSLEFEGRHICWRRFGEGPPLVLVHGGHGSWLHWVRNIETLAQRFTVWVPDLPGYGDSDDAGSAGLQNLLDATLASLDTLVGANTLIDLVGFSFGGLVAAHMAAQRQMIRRLALLGPGGHAGQRRPRGKLMNWQKAADEAALAACMRHNLAMHMVHDPAQIDALAMRVHTDSCRRALFRSKNISQAGGLSAALDQQGSELLLAWGEHDVTAEPGVVAQTLTAGYPRRQAHIVQGAGHWVQYEQADEINRMLLGWLDAA
ncbi:alpha/beta fold hydrolase [Polaromonas sp. UC242_47]|uniref:alpha/beta fold hydrolase n=1 Tax=Polaromonas sp. UC242_47 TaxID=3374626 RepID=UPI0037A3D8B7